MGWCEVGSRPPRLGARVMSPLPQVFVVRTSAGASSLLDDRPARRLHLAAARPRSAVVGRSASGDEGDHDVGGRSKLSQESWVAPILTAPSLPAGATGLTKLLAGPRHRTSLAAGRPYS